MKTCDNEYMIFEYIENELSPEEKEGLELHMKSCLSCREAFEEYTRLSSNISRFYDQVNLDKNEKSVPVEISRVESAYKKNWQPLFLAAVFVISFAYILMFLDANFTAPDNTNLSGNSSMSQTGIDESRWNLNVNLIQNQIDIIRSEIESINKFKNMRQL